MIVAFIVIYMMTYFSLKKGSSKFFTKYYNMFKNITLPVCPWMVWHQNLFVTLFNYKRFSIGKSGTLIRTIFSFVRRNVDFNATIKTQSFLLYFYHLFLKSVRTSMSSISKIMFVTITHRSVFSTTIRNRTKNIISSLCNPVTFRRTIFCIPVRWRDIDGLFANLANYFYWHNNDINQIHSNSQLLFDRPHFQLKED